MNLGRPTLGFGTRRILVELLEPADILDGGRELTPLIRIPIVTTKRYRVSFSNLPISEYVDLA
jgi:hypothetical protein